MYADGSQAFIVSGSEDGLIIAWDVVSKSILQILSGHEGPVLGLDTLPGQELIVSGGLDRTVRIWETFEIGDIKSEEIDM